MTKFIEYERIAQELDGIDIAMLFLNAGMGLMGPFTDITGPETEEIVTVNALHPIYLIKALLNSILKRNARTAIVITSSGLGSAPMPGILAYSCSKSFSSFLGEGLNWELKDKVDVLSWQCGEVSTKLLGKSRKGFTVITTEKASKACLKSIGSRSLTYGPAVHEFQMMITPSWVIKWAIFANSAKVLKAYRTR